MGCIAFYQIKAAEAQIEAALSGAEAAKAGVQTAKATQLSATYVRWSVIVAIISLLLACIAALASSVQSYVAWKGRNDLVRSALETAAINACGGSRVSALETATLNVFERVRDQLPTSEQLTIALTQGNAFYGFIGKAAIVMEMGRALNISGAEEAAAEYEKMIKKYSDINAKTNTLDPQDTAKSDERNNRSYARLSSGASPPLRDDCNQNGQRELG